MVLEGSTLLFVILLSCTEGATVDSDVSGDTGVCADAPTVTWDNFGAGFTTENCQSCHATETPERYGAPEDVVFDSYEDTMASAGRVLARVLAEQDTMPPLGGVAEDDKVMLEYWLVCHEGL